MSKRDINKWRFAAALLGVPAAIHFIFAVCHLANATASSEWFWPQYFLSMTSPYLFLSLLFLAHCDVLNAKSRRSAYCGAGAAWFCMMAFSGCLILSCSCSSTIGPTGAALSIVLTPICYLPFMFPPYGIGLLIGMFGNHGNQSSSETDESEKPTRGEHRS